MNVMKIEDIPATDELLNQVLIIRPDDTNPSEYNICAS